MGTGAAALEASGRGELIGSEVGLECWLSGGRRKRRSRGLRGSCWRRVLLFEADVPQVTIIDADDAVVLLEEALLLGLPSPLQTLD